nr:MAG TPA: hypothetical protein [Caudoviricetes sp.]
MITPSEKQPLSQKSGPRVTALTRILHLGL